MTQFLIGTLCGLLAILASAVLFESVSWCAGRWHRWRADRAHRNWDPFDDSPERKSYRKGPR